MNEQFKIYPEQLREGRNEEIQEQFDPEFMGLDDPELLFEEPVSVVGEAYLADDDLVLHLEVHTTASMPCAICNEPVPVPLELSNLYHVVPLAEIKGGVFFLQELLRENLLLEVPKFAECNDGNCPRRADIAKFMKKNEPDSAKVTTKHLHSGEEFDGEGYHPFADINLD